MAYPEIFPAGYSGSQVLRWALKDGIKQKLYPASDAGLYSHSNLGASIRGFDYSELRGSLSSSISGYYPANLTASIVATYCQSRGTKQYVVGYVDGVPKFIEGRQNYTCVDFLSAYVKSTSQAYKNLSATIKPSRSSFRDLSTFIIAGKEIFSDQRDLGVAIKGDVSFLGSLSSNIVGVYCYLLTSGKYAVGYEDGQPKFITGRSRYRCVDFLSASINQIYYTDLSASIVGKPLAFSDLGSYVKGVLKQDDYSLRGSVRGWIRAANEDLTAFIRGLSYENITAFLRGLAHESLPAEIHPIPPSDLSGYLKVWPMEHLPGSIHGWQETDLTAFIDWNDMRQMPAYIGAHPPKNLTARIKGWVREATFDLGAWIRSLQYEGLGGSIKGTLLEDLPAYLFPVQPENLQGLIHGWDTKDLSAYVNGRYGPHDLLAYIGMHSPVDLCAYINSTSWTLPYDSDLSAYIYSATGLMQQADLASLIAAHSPGDLGAVLTARGYTRSLPAFIYPKMVFMTTALSVSTMEHANLGGIINFICNSSDHKNLGAIIEFSYLRDLATQITGKKYPSYSANMGATVGYASTHVYTDRIPVSLTIGTGYSIEDKIPIILDIFKQQAYLSATVAGVPVHNDMGAFLNPVWLQEYEFDNIKVHELVYDLNHAKQVNWYEVVELYFQSIVPEYFYVGTESKVYKANIANRWRLDVASFVPEDIELGIRRKLHRLKTLYDLTKFNNLDEAIRFAIHYVTSYDSGDLSSIITATGGYMNLMSYIIPKYFTTEDGALGASISAQSKSFVLGYDDKVEFI